MLPECIGHIAIRIAQEGCTELKTYLKERATCLIPIGQFSRNRRTSVKVIDDTFRDIVIPLNFGRRDVDVYVRVKITGISPDVDKYGRPFVRVNYELLEGENIYAVHTRGDSFVEQAFFSEDSLGHTVLHISPDIASGLQELTRAPEIVIVHPQDSPFYFPLKIKVKYFTNQQ